jgi:hypothetical protein
MATTAAAVFRRTADRELGTTESNWCAAVDSGTGITLSCILFGHRLSLSRVEGAVRELLATNPRLRSNITRRNRTLWFETRDEEVSVNISEIDWNEAHGAGIGEEDGEEDEETEEATTAVVEEVWHRILEAEMNIPFPSVFPFPVFETKLYHLTAGTSFLVFRLHAAAADMSCTSTVARSFVDSLHRLDQLEKAGQKSIIKAAYQGSREEGEEEEELQQLPSMEAAIPPGQAKKPFWAHGVDVVGYGLSSRRHAYLPFRNFKAPRMSRFIPATLTIEATDQLLKVISFLTSKMMFCHRASHAVTECKSSHRKKTSSSCWCAF